MMQTIAADMRHCDHPMPMPHFRALKALSQHSLTVSELAEAHKVSLPTVSNTVTILVNSGWAERVDDLDDRRKVVLRITEAGTAAVLEMETQLVALVAGVLAELDDSELDTVAAGFQVMRGLALRRGAAA